MMIKIPYLLAACVLLIGMTNCSGNTESTHSDTIQTSPTEFSFYFDENGFPGTYQFTDEKGVVCKIVLKNDNTFTAESSNTDDVKTGTWEAYNNSCPQLYFDDAPLFFTFPEGKDEGNIKQSINGSVISDDGYLYALSAYYDAQKSDKRLSIRKIN